MTTKDKLLKYLEPYNGSFRHLKEKLLIKRYGSNIVGDILTETTFLDNVSLQERCYCIIKDIKHRIVCQTCGSAVRFKTNEVNGSRYPKTCSNKCKGANKNVQDKKRQTNIDKYGSPNVLNSAMVVEIREKKLLETVGATNYFLSGEYKKRYSKGEFDKAREQNKQKIKESMLDFGYDRVIQEVAKFDVKPEFTRSEYCGHFNKYNWKCCKCNQVFYKWLGSVYDIICPSCNYRVGTNIEQFIEDVILEHKLPYYPRSKSILSESRQLDFYLPEQKIAIETNGLYWHSDDIIPDKNYHINKTVECESKGIRLLQIFEDEIRNKPEIVKDRLCAVLHINSTRVYARNCVIVDIPYKEVEEFYNANHIQGSVKSRLNYGLTYNGKLVACASFTSLRPATGNTNVCATEYELTRYASLLGYSVVGGFSRLLKHFIRLNKPTRIISYCDRRWSSGNMYIKNGFNLLKTSQPNYWYITKDCMHRLHRYAFQKHLLLKKLEKFDNTLTEYENMKNNGYKRIWDCGSYLFEYLVVS